MSESDRVLRPMEEFAEGRPKLLKVTKGIAKAGWYSPCPRLKVSSDRFATFFGDC